MLIENSSNLIASHQPRTLANGIQVHEAELINGNALVIGPDSLSLYRRPGDCLDSLGKGFIRSAAFDAEFLLTDYPLIERHQAGFVQLSGGAGLLIGLNDARLFRSANDALRNHDEICRISLAEDQSR
jgi:hypothetical protein